MYIRSHLVFFVMLAVGICGSASIGAKEQSVPVSNGSFTTAIPTGSIEPSEGMRILSHNAYIGEDKALRIVGVTVNETGKRISFGLVQIEGYNKAGKLVARVNDTLHGDLTKQSVDAFSFFFRKWDFSTYVLKLQLYRVYSPPLQGSHSYAPDERWETCPWEISSHELRTKKTTWYDKNKKHKVPYSGTLFIKGMVKYKKGVKYMDSAGKYSLEPAAAIPLVTGMLFDKTGNLVDVSRGMNTPSWYPKAGPGPGQSTSFTVGFYNPVTYNYHPLLRDHDDRYVYRLEIGGPFREACAPSSEWPMTASGREK